METKSPEERPVPFGGLLSLGGRAVHPFERLARRVLGRDGDLKVLAVVAALVVYVLVEPLTAGIERTVAVPVHVLPQGGYTVVGFEPAALFVTLHGTTEGFTAFDPDALRVELRPKPGEGVLSAEIEVGLKDVTNVLDRLRVVGVSPARVKVEYDYMSVSETKDFVAKPNLTGLDRLRGTAAVSEESLENLANLTVKVYGSEKKLRALKDKGVRLPTDPVDVVGKTESFDIDVAIRPPEDLGITKVEPDRVRVHVDVEIEKDPDSESIHVSDPIRLSPEDAESKSPDAKSAGPDAVSPAGEPSAPDGNASDSAAGAEGE